MPDIPNGAYTVSFRNGLRGIVFGIDEDTLKRRDYFNPFRRLTIADPTRRHLGLPIEVATWFEDEWSECFPPTSEEREGFQSNFSDEIKRQLRGARFDFVCRFDIENEVVYRGLVFSVPKL